LWTLPQPPANEIERLDVLSACSIMDTGRDERFDRLTRLATRFYDADVAFIGLVDADFQWMKAVNSEEIAPFIARKDSVCNLIIESGEPLIVGDLKTDPRLEGHPIVPLLTLRFYAGVPLVVAPDLVIGSMCVMRRDAADTSSFDVEPLRELAAIAIDEIELHKLNQELTRLSQIDALTGIANRRGFDDAIDRAVRRAHRTGAPLSLLLIDLDRFKPLNDMLGHQAGDEVLRRLGGLLAGAVSRPYDATCRYGGEEFAIVLPDTDSAGACHVAERLQRWLAEAALPHPLGGFVTASTGVATLSGHEVEAGKLVAAADAALYEAKRRGRDCIVAGAEVVSL
jgi:diguanylate cyclase (GGDEF)-like protein